MARLSLVAVLLAAFVFAPDAAQERESQKAALAKVQGLVGDWRGTGQVQRGSNKGAWIEKADWAWKFTDKRATLEAKIADGKYFRSLAIESGKDGEYQMVAQLAEDKGQATYRGKFDDEGKLVLAADTAPAGFPARVTLRFVAGGDRLLVLYEKLKEASGQLARMSEVGYTRQGSGFGKGSTGPECVVTGGLGTIQVSHAGKTYYVCCTGCRDYFNDNPEEALAEYKARKEAEKAKK